MTARLWSISDLYLSHNTTRVIHTMHEHSSPPCLIREHGMPLVQLLSSNASDPVDARWHTFGDIIDVDVSAVGRWLRRCARRSGCATCINCAAKFTPTRR